MEIQISRSHCPPIQRMSSLDTATAPKPLTLRSICIERTPLPYPFWLAPGSGIPAAYSRRVRFGFPGSVASLPFGKGNLEHELAYSACRSLAHWSPICLTRLRPLRSSRLSAGVVTTMSRSDSSVIPRGIGPVGSSEFSLGHARFSSHHPSANHVTDSCAGLHHCVQAGPSVPPNRVHLRSGLVFGYDPFTDHPYQSRWSVVFSYRRYYTCTGPPGGISTR